VDEDQPLRYAHASGDFNPIHLDPKAAQQLGMPGIILHGMCAVAMCCRAVMDTVTDGHPDRLSRVAVRFLRPVFPGSNIEVSVYELESTANRLRYGFIAKSNNRIVMNDGRMEINP
jgi:acyl dehydratase